ncbi:MAG: DUF6883 domain-containing protein, partial [Candidatus Acidiferrales bacterium]
MKLPNPERAVVDIEKLRGYCLNPQHLRGRHKARVFAAVLGITAEKAELLRTALLEAALHREATPTEQDTHGQRYVLDFELDGPSGRGMVRSCWIVRAGETFPRLTTCYVLKMAEGESMKTKVLDVVALLEDMPARGLLRGQVGTVVEELDGD